MDKNIETHFLYIRTPFVSEIRPIWPYGWPLSAGRNRQNQWSFSLISWCACFALTFFVVYQTYGNAFIPKDYELANILKIIFLLQKIPGEIHYTLRSYATQILYHLDLIPPQIQHSPRSHTPPDLTPSSDLIPSILYPPKSYTPPDLVPPRSYTSPDLVPTRSCTH